MSKLVLVLGFAAFFTAAHGTYDLEKRNSADNEFGIFPAPRVIHILHPKPTPAYVPPSSRNYRPPIPSENVPSPPQEFVPESPQKYETPPSIFKPSEYLLPPRHHYQQSINDKEI
ncbi:unnamed protein product [Allacma fusca]|uniref:Uncharacterized protein n=1 Tax=Allacma fusca TaxID=39272 RepID=A0A8J2PU51_9HEXA|nr:unnamed protein product [Allacma fusca]